MESGNQTPHTYTSNRMRFHSHTCTQNFYFFQYIHPPTHTHTRSIPLLFLFSFLFSSFLYLCKCLNSFHQDGPRYVSIVLFRLFVCFLLFFVFKIKTSRPHTLYTKFIISFAMACINPVLCRPNESPFNFKY